MHIDERLYGYGYLNSDNVSRTMKSKYDIYLYGIQNINITNGSAKSEWIFNYCGDKSYVGNNENMTYGIPYKYLTPNSILSITGYIITSVADNPLDKIYYPLPYFEPEDNPGSGIDIRAVSVHTNPGKTGSAITIDVYKHTRCGTWQGNSNKVYYFYFKVESMGDH